METLTAFLNLLRRVLQGEPLRAIGYGAIAVVFLVSRALVLTGYWTDAPSLDAIILAVSATVAGVTEFARRYVYSPITVAVMRAELTPDPLNLPIVNPDASTSAG